MSSVFSKNAIMAGCVDYYCLPCDTPLRTDEDAVQHIAKPIHKKNLDGTSLMDKYKDDRVRKVKKGYFCELCNLFMRTAAKVGPHVAEATHKENKTRRLFRRVGTGVLALDTVLIGESAWHGLIDDTCAVCDAEFENQQIHKTDSWHTLNLVLIEIEVSHDRNVYRKVDESTFQCLTCNMVCAVNTMTSHFEDEEHKKLYQKCCDAAKAKLNEKPDPADNAKEDKQKKSPGIKTEKSVKETDKNPEEKADTKAKDDKTKCDKETPKKSQKESAKQETSKKPSDKEDKTKKESEKEDKGPKDLLGKTDKDICKGLGAVDYITRDVCGKQWCILCDWAMDDHAVEAHIKSRHHLTILKMHKERTEKQAKESDTENLDGAKNIVLNFPTEFRNNDIDFDAEAKTAFCRKCSKSMEFDYLQVTNHIEEHKKAANKPDQTKANQTKPEQTKPNQIKPEQTKPNQIKPAEAKASSSEQKAVAHKEKPKQEKESRASSVASNREDAEVENYAKQHNLTYTKESNNAFCRVCVIKVPASIKNMREHINGVSHKNKVAKTTVKTTTKTPVMTPSHAFIDHVITIENMFSKDIVINEKYVVNIFSFLMITKNGGKLRCQACEMNVAVSEIDAHKNTPKHERVMNDAMVASSEETEFIREIRPNLFHCGYCNQLEATWATMESHLKSTAHREAKTAASWRMVEYSPMIAQHKARQRMQFALFTRMLMGQMFGDD